MGGKLLAIVVAVKTYGLLNKIFIGVLKKNG